MGPLAKPVTLRTVQFSKDNNHSNNLSTDFVHWAVPEDMLIKLFMTPLILTTVVPQFYRQGNGSSEW